MLKGADRFIRRNKAREEPKTVDDKTKKRSIIDISKPLFSALALPALEEDEPTEEQSATEEDELSEEKSTPENEPTEEQPASEEDEPTEEQPTRTDRVRFLHRCDHRMRC